MITNNNIFLQICILQKLKSFCSLIFCQFSKDYATLIYRGTVRNSCTSSWHQPGYELTPHSDDSLTGARVPVEFEYNLTCSNEAPRRFPNNATIYHLFVLECLKLQNKLVR